MSSIPKKFSINIQVQQPHLDAVNHVNNVVYIQWMQDIASMHWHAVATPELKNKFVWMIRRHEVDYHNQAFLNDNLLITTWTGEYTNVTWKRHYEITRPADNKKIISAVSLWIPVDVEAQKPQRVDEAMVSLFMQ
jgi:acyl-CoA thioester hydrolase